MTIYLIAPLPYCVFNDQKLFQWFFGPLNVGAFAIIMGWSVVEKSEPEMAGCWTMWAYHLQGGRVVLCVHAFLSAMFFYFFFQRTPTWCWTTWVYHLEGGRVVLRGFLFGHLKKKSSALLLGVGLRGSITSREGGWFLRAGNPNCRCCRPKSPPTLLRTRHKGVRRALAGYQATLFKDTF